MGVGDWTLLIFFHESRVAATGASDHKQAFGKIHWALLLKLALATELKIKLNRPYSCVFSNTESGSEAPGNAMI